MSQRRQFVTRTTRSPPPHVVGGDDAVPAVTGPTVHCCLSVHADPIAIRTALLEIRRHFSCSCTGEMIGRLELVLAEILNNICEHGGLQGQAPDAPMGKVHVSMAEAVGGIYCIVSDKGEAVPEACLAPRGLPVAEGGALPDSLAEGGYGWFMIQTMVRKLYYGRDQGRNVLSFLIPCENPCAA